MNFLVNLLVGHVFGDFWLQPKWMAMKKGAGTKVCIIHCLVYTAAVSALTLYDVRSIWWPLYVFATHFPIDRWSLADKWLKAIDGRSLPDFIQNGSTGVPDKLPFLNYVVLRGAFTGAVYTIVDNSMHFVLMWYGARLLFNVAQ